MESIKKTNYFYIDESGNISNDSKIFIHGCIKTDSPKAITDAFLKLKETIKNSIYYLEIRDSILKQGFHASVNNKDIQAEVYKLIPLLDYRAYFVITNKETSYFTQKMTEMDESDYFAHSINKLLKDRIVAHKNDKNIFYFEKINLRKKSLTKVLDNFFSKFDSSYDLEYHIVGKEEENLAIVDYLNFIFHSFLVEEVTMKRMELNFNLVASKIGLVNYTHNNLFFARKKNDDFKVSLENLKTKY